MKPVVPITGYGTKNATSPGGAMEWIRAISVLLRGLRFVCRQPVGLHHRLMSDVLPRLILAWHWRGCLSCRWRLPCRRCAPVRRCILGRRGVLWRRRIPWRDIARRWVVPRRRCRFLDMTILLRLFSRRITLQASSPGLRLGQLSHPSANANPALGCGLFTILLRLFLRRITLQASALGLCLGELNHFSAHAHPAFGCGVSAILLRLFPGRITLQASPPGLRLGQLNHFSAHANPAHFGCAVPLRHSL